MKKGTVSALLLVAMSTVVGGCTVMVAPPGQTTGLGTSGNDWSAGLHGLTGPGGTPPRNGDSTTASEGGTGTSSKPDEAQKANNQASATTSPAPVKQDALPLTSYADKDSIEKASPVSFANAYTRIRITANLPETPKRNSDGKVASTDPNANTASMVYRERNYITRYLFGDKHDLSLTAKITVNGYQETIPLATLVRVSNSDGQSWLRDMASDLSAFPWILVKKSADQTNVPNVVVEFRGSQTYESGVAGKALDVTLNGIKLISPEAGVITTLSSNAAKNKATAIDNAISALFSKQLTEIYRNDRKFNTWSPDGGLEVTLNLPRKDGDWNGDLAQVGRWTVNFDAPRPSVFSDWYLCDPLPTKGSGRCKKTFDDAALEVAKEKNAASILVFPLVKTTAGNVSIRDYLQQQAWFTNAVTSFSTTADANARAAGNVCVMVADSVLKLGLNDFDAAMVVWAVINGVPSMPAAESSAWQTRACKDMVARVSRT